MSDNNSTIAGPQFATAEYSAPQPANSCKICQQAIPASFYRANGSVVCGRCADRIRRETPQDSHAAFVRAFLFGLGGFAIGLALYAGFVIATGISIGYISLAVGWIVGKAMMMGSGGVGGRRYQITAVHTPQFPWLLFRSLFPSCAASRTHRRPVSSRSSRTKPLRLPTPLPKRLLPLRLQRLHQLPFVVSRP
jgi:hypothetical protein